MRTIVLAAVCVALLGCKPATQERCVVWSNPHRVFVQQPVFTGDTVFYVPSVQTYYDCTKWEKY